MKRGHQSVEVLLDLAGRCIGSNGTETDPVERDVVARLRPARGEARNRSRRQNVSAVAEYRRDILLSANRKRARRQESWLLRIHRERIRGARASGRLDNQRLRTGPNIRGYLNVDLARADVIQERRLSADGHRRAGQRGGPIDTVEVRTRPRTRVGGEVRSVNLKPGSGRHRG